MSLTSINYHNVRKVKLTHRQPKDKLSPDEVGYSWSTFEITDSKDDTFRLTLFWDQNNPPIFDI